MLFTSILRTVVPYAWGLVVTWLITLLPVLAPLEGQLLGLATIALPILAAVLSAAWYAFWRWFEPRLPVWLTRAVLGSAKTPVYVKPAVISQVPTIFPEPYDYQGKHASDLIEVAPGVFKTEAEIRAESPNA